MLIFLEVTDALDGQPFESPYIIALNPDHVIAIIPFGPEHSLITCALPFSTQLFSPLSIRQLQKLLCPADSRQDTPKEPHP